LNNSELSPTLNREVRGILEPLLMVVQALLKMSPMGRVDSKLLMTAKL
jgi:hypothetical protein